MEQPTRPQNYGLITEVDSEKIPLSEDQKQILRGVMAQISEKLSTEDILPSFLDLKIAKGDTRKDLID